MRDTHPTQQIESLSRALASDLEALPAEHAVAKARLQAYGRALRGGAGGRDIDGEADRDLSQVIDMARAQTLHAARAAVEVHRQIDLAMLGGIVLIALGCLGAGLMTGFAIARPIARLTRVMTLIAGGRLDTPVPTTLQRDAAKRRVVMEREMEETRARGSAEDLAQRAQQQQA